MAVALVAWIAMRLLRVNAATRYWVWWSVLAVTVLPWLRPIPAPPASSAPVTLPAAPIEEGFNWLAWVIAAWAVFAVYRAGRIAWGFGQLWVIKNSARPADATRLEHWRQACGVNRPVALMVSDRIQLPMAVGFLKPAVILPEILVLNADEMDHVLLHELAHIARRDDWTNLAARLVGVVLGLHPVAAFALARIERERELACDDFVVAATGEARSYAESLTHLFEMARGVRQPVLASGVMGSRLGYRVEQLLTRGRRFERGASSLSFTAIVAVMLGVAFVAEHLPGWVAYAQAPARPAAPVAPAKQPPPPAVATADAQTQRLEALLARLEQLVERLSRANPGEPSKGFTIRELLRSEELSNEVQVREAQLQARRAQLEAEVTRAREQQNAQTQMQRDLYDLQRKLDEALKALQEQKR
jgi:beta-lactamase regulating signal transducer with metallopeptidase domain